MIDLLFDIIDRLEKLNPIVGALLSVLALYFIICAGVILWH